MRTEEEILNTIRENNIKIEMLKTDLKDDYLPISQIVDLDEQIEVFQKINKALKWVLGAE